MENHSSAAIRISQSPSWNQASRDYSHGLTHYHSKVKFETNLLIKSYCYVFILTGMEARQETSQTPAREGQKCSTEDQTEGIGTPKHVHVESARNV